MPQMQNVVLKTDLPSLVTHTFKPMSLNNDIGSYMDDQGINLTNRQMLTISVRRSTAQNQGHKVVLKLTQPHVHQTSEGECCVPVGTIPPQSHFTVEIVRNKVASDDDIRNLIQQLQEAVADPQFTETAFGESLR